MHAYFRHAAQLKLSRQTVTPTLKGTQYYVCRQLPFRNDNRNINLLTQVKFCWNAIKQLLKNSSASIRKESDYSCDKN